MRQRRKHFSWPFFFITVVALGLVAWVAILTFKAGNQNSRNNAIKTSLASIRQEAEILADGGSYWIVCDDQTGEGIGRVVGIPERNRIAQYVTQIVNNSPNPAINIPICSVTSLGDSVAFFAQTSQGFWCVDSRGYEGFGKASPFSGVCNK